MSAFRDRVAAVLDGAAVGDALGGATEGYTPEAIVQRYGGPVEGIVPPFFADWPTRRPISPYHKGDGHITDDTLMTQALIQVYAARRTHLDAFAIADDLVPLLMNQVRWIPELERETVLLNRIFLAEKWLVTRLFSAHADPREAGVGNVVNCGAAMYMAPVGIVNAGAPAAAYREAIEIAAAHQSSYGREAAGVFAAAVAAALAHDATIDSVLDITVELAHDGTAAACAALVAAGRANRGASLQALNVALREAILPWDTVGPEYRTPFLDARTPSRTKAIEELPVALGILAAYEGDVRRSVIAAVNYGRDSDSIASMAGAIAAALQGPGSVPTEWVNEVSSASRIDLREYAVMLADAAEAILADDRRAAQADLDRLERLRPAEAML